jgi:hypothetical protein
MAKTRKRAAALNRWFGLVLVTPMDLKLKKWYEPTIICTQNVNPRYFSTVGICLEAKHDGWNLGVEWMERSLYEVQTEFLAEKRVHMAAYNALEYNNQNSTAFTHQ